MHHLQRMASYLSAVGELDKLTPEDHIDKPGIHSALEDLHKTAKVIDEVAGRFKEVKFALPFRSNAPLDLAVSHSLVFR